MPLLVGALNFVVCCFPRVSYRASPSFHPGLCRSIALSGLFVGLFAVSPGFHIGLCPHFTLGYAGVSPFQGSLSDWLRISRVSYRALPSFLPGLCGSAALSGLFVGLAVCTQGSISGFALISPWALQEYRPFRALCRIGCLRSCVVVLCSLNVFGGCKMDCCVRSCYCICLIVLFVGLIGVVGQ